MPHLDQRGVRLHYRDTGSGDPPLVFIHGWSCNLRHWDGQARAFGKRHRVVRLDLRGHGRSDAPPGDYTMQRFADDVAWSLRKLAVRRPVIIGHSMGGVIALRLAADHPRLARAVVIVDAPVQPDTPRQRTAFFRKAVGPAADRPFGQDFARGFIRGLFSDDFDPIIADREAARSAQTTAHVLDAALRSVNAHDNRDALRKLAAPTLYIAASRTPLPTAQIRAGLQPKGAWFGEAVGSGHFVMLEAPDQFNAMLKRFLRSL